jgi:aminobenzoyl-glutamate utilization protein B
VPGTSPHSWQAVACGGTSIGTKGMMVAAKTMTLAGMEMFSSPQLLIDAKAELERRRGAGFKSLFGFGFLIECWHHERSSEAKFYSGR